MKNLTGLNKKQLTEILVNEYGYEKSDLKDEDGKPFTNATLKAMIQSEEQDAEKLEVEETVIKAKDAPIKDEDLIVVMNGLDGALTHRSISTGRVWRFIEFGQTDKIPYGELLRIRNNNPKVFNDGWMIILNRKVQEDFGLVEAYRNILTPETIDEVFTKDVDELKAFVDALPKGMKVTFVSKARQLYNAKKLDSMRVIEYIQSEFGISLEDNAPISDIAVKAKEKN